MLNSFSLRIPVTVEKLWNYWSTQTQAEAPHQLEHKHPWNEIVIWHKTGNLLSVLSVNKWSYLWLSANFYSQEATLEFPQSISVKWVYYHAFVCRTEHLLLAIKTNNQGRYWKHQADFKRFVPFQKGRWSHESTIVTFKSHSILGGTEICEKQQQELYKQLVALLCLWEWWDPWAAQG